MKYYAVRHGRQNGVYLSWEACRAQVEGYAGAQYKSFSNRGDAESYVFLPIPSPKKYPSSIRQSLNNNPDLPSGIQIWVDGACIEQPNGELRIGWAYVILESGKEIQRSNGNDIPENSRPYRNVAGEIMAVLKAVSWCQEQGIEDITIHYDYQGLESWVTGAWKSKTPLTKDYTESLRTSGIVIHWVKVKAHSGEPMNDLVDRLAGEAALQKENPKIKNSRA